MQEPKEPEPALPDATEAWPTYGSFLVRRECPHSATAASEHAGPPTQEILLRWRHKGLEAQRKDLNGLGPLGSKVGLDLSPAGASAVTFHGNGQRPLRSSEGSAGYFFLKA